MAQNRLAVSGWPLRRKLALAVTIPILLAAVFGGLRVRSELEQSANYAASASQVDVLGPAIAYLSEAEKAVVASRANGQFEVNRAAALKRVQDAGAALEKAGANPDLTAAQREQVDSVLSLSSQLRTEMGYVSLGQSMSQVRQLHRGVAKLIATIEAAQLEPNAKLQLVDHAIDGRLSLAMQQLQVAYGAGTKANVAELAAELGVEAAAIDRLGAVLGPTTPEILQLKQQNAVNFGNVRDGSRDLGGEEAFGGYDELTDGLLTAIDDELASEASEARTLAIVNSVVTGLALLAALILVLLVSRWLLNPIRRVREGALIVANEKLPAAVKTIRGGGDPGEIEPIDVTTEEEMGQLARAVDDLHRQAVHLASGEAALRSQVSDMFVTLSRRNTGLVNQQLALIEGLERDEEDPQRLENLFKLDHLASRMRRTAESLMVLADTPAQGPVSDTLTVADALHAATAGVADYQRVQILSTPGDRIVPVAAGDVVHMVTELLDNALAYSPPTAPVLVMTTTTITATTIRITDSGLGIDHDAMSELNNVLKSGGEVNAETARRMGLLVVSRLARRHGITVSLERTERGGVTATVVIPRNLLRRGEETDDVVEPRKPVPPAVASASPYTTPASATATAAPTPATQAPAAAEVDPIEAAINAVIGLPQRRPGATGAGALAATSPEGGSLLQRNTSDDRPGADRPGADRPGADRPGGDRPVSERPGAERFFLGARKEPLGALGVKEANEDGDDLAAHEATAPEADLHDSASGPIALGAPAPVAHDDAQDHDESGDHEGQGAQILSLPTRSPFERPARPDEAAEHADPGTDAGEVRAEEELPAPEPAGAPAVATPPTGSAAVHAPVAETHAALPTRTPAGAASALDADTPVEHTGEVETPIFRALRSNWLSSGGDGEQPWTDSEVEAGWEAADRVAESAPLQHSESGLPVRRPGGRLVPGGVSSAAKPIVRDPEAIRARLSAHRAGVARGRTAATPSTDASADPGAGPGSSDTPHDTPHQKEAGLV